MGFFSFLSRKSHDKGGKSHNFFKSQSYGSTSAGALPVQGPYPVAGNGPNLLETLTRSRPEFSQTHLSLNSDHVAVAAAPAPAPAVPRFRDESMERPRTAPNGSNSNPTWANASSRLKKHTSRGAPPVSFRMFKRDPTIQEPRPVSRGTENVTPKPSFGHSRSNSIRSESGRGFKDILDAQSEIRPADFKTRLQATGARDYGEDVADRNLGQNGFNLEAPHVQAFYAQCQSQSSARLRRTESSDPLARPDQKASSYGTGVRTKSLTSSSPLPLPFLNNTVTGAPAALLRALQPPEGAPYFAPSSSARNRKPSSVKDATRRQSINTYMSPTSSKDERSSMDRHIHFHPVPPPEPQGLTKRPLSPRPSTATPILVNAPLVTKLGPFRPPLFPRDSLLLARQRSAADATASDHGLDEANCNRSRKERSFSLRSSLYTPRSLSASASAGLPRKRHSLHALQSSVASRETPPIDPTPGRGLESRPPTSKQDEQDEMPLVIPTLPIEGAVSEPAKPTSAVENSNPSRSSPEPSTSHEPQPTPQDPHPDSSPTTTTTFPPKTRSLRAWSASSATATISDTSSSNPFQRPQSLHTTNTSVDLSNASSSLKKSSSRTSLNTTPPVVTAPTTPQTPKSTTFNIDDYLSSDSDSLAGNHRPTAQDEEDLLFNSSGYGLLGTQLPGLFDSSLTSASRQSSSQSRLLLHRHRSSPSFSSPPPSNGGGRRRMVYTGDSFGRAAGRRYILDTGAEGDEGSDEFYSGEEEEEEDEDGDSLFSAEIRSPPLLQPSRVVSRSSTTRPRSSGFYSSSHHGRGGGGYFEGMVEGERGSSMQHRGVNVIEEEREGGVVDVKAAVRLRKEVKARKRAAAAAVAVGGRGKKKNLSDLKGVRVGVREVGGGDVGGEEEEGNTADVE